MENKEKQNDNKELDFFGKVKKAIAKFFKGIKNFFIKTGRVNSKNCYGCIEGIGDFLVYEDHALISAVGMDDVTFTKDNVVSYSFEGLGKIRRKKATVKYKIVLDEKVVFPDLVLQKNDVRNLTALITVEKDRSHFLCSGNIEYGKGNNGLMPYENCDIYGYDTCFVIVVKLERIVGDKREKYEESLLYPLADIEVVEEKINKGFSIKFNDKRNMYFTASSAVAYNYMKNLIEE